jgi:dUTP pyrophosphatase
MQYATKGACAVDLRACRLQQGRGFASFDAPVALMPGEKTPVGSGIAVNLGSLGDSTGSIAGEGLNQGLAVAGLILPRSGLGSKLEIVLANLVGLCDVDYQGEIIMAVKNNGSEPFLINPMDRIAQYMIVPVFRPEFVRVDEFGTDTERGASGFGSTGMG